MLLSYFKFQMYVRRTYFLTKKDERSLHACDIEYEGHDCLRAVNFMRDEAHLEVLRKSKRKMKNKIQIG